MSIFTILLIAVCLIVLTFSSSINSNHVSGSSTPLNVLDQAYFINVKQELKRCKHIQQLCKRLGFVPHNIDAITPSSPQYTAYTNRIPNTKDWKRGVAACMLSHVESWKVGVKHINMSDDWITIFEDDALLNPTTTYSQASKLMNLVFSHCSKSIQYITWQNGVGGIREFSDSSKQVHLDTSHLNNIVKSAGFHDVRFIVGASPGVVCHSIRATFAKTLIKYAESQKEIIPSDDFLYNMNMRFKKSICVDMKYPSSIAGSYNISTSGLFYNDLRKFASVVETSTPA